MPFFYRTPDLVAYAKKEADITVKSDMFQLGLVLAQLFTRWNPCRLTEDHRAPVELDRIESSTRFGMFFERRLSRNLHAAKTIATARRQT